MIYFRGLEHPLWSIFRKGDQMKRIPTELGLALLGLIAIVVLSTVAPGEFDRKPMPTPTVTLTITSTAAAPPATPVAVPVYVPAKVAPGSGKHILGGECSVPYARSNQDSDLICSPDCGMTWRSEAHPGVCY